MKNIIWLASYPKSGNTLFRLFLSCYLFTDDGILKDFHLIRNITVFNHFHLICVSLCPCETFKNRFNFDINILNIIYG